jgi:hypothetical protein
VDEAGSEIRISACHGFMKPAVTLSANLPMAIQNPWPHFLMKHSLHPTHLLILAAPMWALTLVCTAQNLTPATAPPPRSAVLPPQDLHAAGTVSSFDAKGLTVLEPVTGGMTVYLTNADTAFVNTQGRLVPPDLVTVQTPVNVHYTPVGHALLATRVVVNSALTTDGTVVELSPGVMVVQAAGAPAVSLRYVSSNKLKFTDPTGTPLPLQAMAVGTPVRVFYTKAGDVLMATKVQMLNPNAGPSTVTTKTTTTTTRVNP